MRFVPRVRIDGKRTSEEKIMQQISDLLYRKSARPYPLSVAETAKMLGVCRTTVYNYIKRMQKLEKSQTGRFKLPKIPQEKQFRRFNRHHKITSDPLVSEWIDDLTTRKGGEPLKGWKTRVRSVEVVCNSCKIHPSDLLVSHRNTEKILRQFSTIYRRKLCLADILDDQSHLGFQH